MICLPWAPDPKEGDEFPTWIPRLSKSAFERTSNRANHRVGADPLVGKPGVGPKPYSAAKGYPAFWRLKPGDEQCLIVRGFVLDTIKETMSCATRKSIPSDWPDAGGWNNIDYEPPDPFWRTLVGNRNCQGQKPSRLWRNTCKTAFAKKTSRDDLDLTHLTKKCSLIMREFVERVYCITFKRKLVTFDRMRVSESIGLAPSSVAEGDVICILYGCSVPVLLRQCIDRQERKYEETAREDPRVRYMFVGECYVHGMMDGEAFKNTDLNFKSREQNFELI